MHRFIIALAAALMAAPAMAADVTVAVTAIVEHPALDATRDGVRDGLAKAGFSEGDKIDAGKKSYAVSFILQDETKTLNDAQIDKIMQKLQQSFEKNVGATLR